MQEQIVGFFTHQSAQSWFFEYGDQVEVVSKKKMEPKGDGSPHLIVRMVVPDTLLNTIYPEGKIMEHAFDEYNGRLC